MIDSDSLKLSDVVRATSLTNQNHYRTSRLMEILADHNPEKKVSLRSRLLRLFVPVEEIRQMLFADSHRQYPQSLSRDSNIFTEDSAEQTVKQHLTVSVIGLGLATAGMFFSPFFYLPAIGCILYAARLYISEGYRALVERHQVDYRTILTLNLSLALAIGAIWQAAFGAVFYLIAFYIVTKTEYRSKQNLASLFGDQIQSVWLFVNGIEVETPIEHLKIGDIVVTYAGQMIPVDGIIVEGTATIDQHMLTGEAQPAEKTIGDTVLASTMIVAGRLHICVEESGDTTVVSQITTMLNQTTDFKQVLQSKTEQRLNKMTLPLLGLSAFALPVAGVNSAVSILWYLPGMRMILFSPLSMLSYLQIATQRGILIKDGRALEVLNEVDTVVFDKTGTLTLGLPEVNRIFCYNGISEDDLLCLAAAAEIKQAHPIARAILTAAQERNLDLPEYDEAKYKVGYGVKVKIDERIARVGSIRFMKTENVTVPEEVAVQQAESHAEGDSLVLIAVDDEVAGAIQLRSAVRDEAKALVETLQARDLEVMIMSGDHDAPTRRLATELGITRYYSDVLPKDKANLVEQMQNEGKKVCFVGDGINDAIAMKTSDLSISLRGATTIATDIAQIVFMDGTLAQLPTLFTTADEFTANIRVNWIATSLPCIVGIAGTLLFGWGMGTCVLLIQASTPVGIYNGLKPLLDERRNRK